MIQVIGRSCVLGVLMAQAHVQALAQVHRCEVDGKLVFTDRPCDADKARSPGDAAASSANPVVDFRVTLRHYKVTGRTLAQAYMSLRANGPSGWAGMARWNVAFEQTPKPVKGGCEVSNLRIRVSGDILMPHWVDADQASPKDRLTWQSMYDRLKIHEDGHVLHGREFAVLLRERLMGFGVVPCNELDARLQQEKARLFENLRHRDADYDRRTDHGLRQDNPR